MFPILSTPRIKLREITEVDADTIFDCFSQKEVIRYYGQEKFTTIQEARVLIDIFAENYRNQKGMRWGIERLDTGELIGTVGFNQWSQKHKRAEIGYELHPQHWGHGYASEAASAVMAYGFDNLQLVRIGAVVFLENKASQHVLEKLGFQKEGVLKNYMYQNGKAHDTFVYSSLPTT
ncbi:GNAT family N-acetyltransferase [Priestia megaterium]|uniref:GNAT family N-acetyltransferase n=1 Tax=Priestia megaterium TaxID=1404 RepID=UPI0013E3ACD8|nr:GNAT family N-acetyltransferase [Priestia megaterium]MED3863581.1 GNAT family N-acetyltransferase [Priestia megaterium]MED4101363.1 GNAT family N-acetyltransferase [Priestia megaterium]MED4145084.1 GNAT family N-acetyltransferase [Priestia megaterium]MED4169940.1 GNAT family N-acetyltransferase [Priestia megaterium]MED4199296.1 GNAT family N-acetyltransferase [Priestia megaterium]